MAFSLQVGGRGQTRSASKSYLSLQASFVLLAIAVVAFCIYDYSPAGSGYVAQSLGSAQRDFQGFVNTFRLKM